MKKLTFTLSLLLLSFSIFAPAPNAQVLPATCDALVTDIPMWGNPARGVDLRAYTDSTLHWIGCPTLGCNPSNFFCNFDPDTETLSFGTNAPAALRSVVDPGNAEGDAMPDTIQPSLDAGCQGCCCEQVPFFGICNAPDSFNNGISIDMADALCTALGYLSGSVINEIFFNNCPEANTLNTEGTDWSSDFVFSDGFGLRYTCVGFRAEINLSPDSAVNDTGTEHTVTASVTTANGPQEGILVQFEITAGPNTGESSDPDSGECAPNDDCTTDANGQVSWTYSSSLPGTDTIITSINEGETESNTVEKTWVLVRNIPTLSQWGFIVMAALIGIAGIIFYRRRAAA